MFLNKDDFIKHYSQQAASYDLHREETPEGAWFRDQEADLVCRLLQLPTGSKLLEAGCGTGRILIPLTRRGYDCYGIDPSEQMLAVLKVKQLLQPDRILLGDIEDIPFQAESFDGVYTTNVLQWLPDGYEKSFREMSRVVKRGGRIVMDFPNENSLWRRVKRLIGIPKEANHCVRYVELIGFFGRFKDISFTVVSNFSYPQVVFRYHGLRIIGIFFERVLPLPFLLRSKFYVVMTKL